MSEDTYNAVKAVQSLAPQEVASDTTVNGSEADLGADDGYERAVILCAVGSRTDGTFTFEVQESDTSGSGFTAVADADLQGTEPGATGDGVTKLGYIGDNRYIRVSMTSTSTTNGGLVAAEILSAGPRTEPV